MAMIFVDIRSLIPENHMLRKIDQKISFDFIYDLLAPYYPSTGRPSIDPVSLFKMLLIVKQCIDSSLIDGKAMAADGSYIPVNISREGWNSAQSAGQQMLSGILQRISAPQSE